LADAAYWIHTELYALVKRGPKLTQYIEIY